MPEAKSAKYWFVNPQKKHIFSEWVDTDPSNSYYHTLVFECGPTQVVADLYDDGTVEDVSYPSYGIRTKGLRWFKTEEEARKFLETCKGTNKKSRTKKCEMNPIIESTLTRLQEAAESYHDMFLNDPHEQFSGDHISRLLCGLAASLKAEQMQQAVDSVPMKKPSLEDAKEALDEYGEYAGTLLHKLYCKFKDVACGSGNCFCKSEYYSYRCITALCFVRWLVKTGMITFLDENLQYEIRFDEREGNR